MSMTIEWVLENASRMVLRLDLSRRNFLRYSNNEGVHAELFFYRGDDEGSVLGHLSYKASEGGPGRIEFSYSARRDEWATLVGDIIAQWQPEWRVPSTNLCRLGKWDRDRDRMIWQSITPGHLLVTQHLARTWGAIEQFAASQQGVDARYVLSSATDDIRGLIARQNDEFRSLTQHL